MTALGLGWKLIGLSCLTLVVAAVVRALPFRTPRMRLLRRVAAGMAIVAAITLIVIVIVGPGPWCGPGDTYKVPGCA